MNVRQEDSKKLRKVEQVVYEHTKRFKTTQYCISFQILTKNVFNEFYEG